MGKDRQKLARLQKIKAAKGMTGTFADVPGNSYTLSAALPYSTGSKDNVVYKKFVSLVSCLLEAINKIRDSKKPGAPKLEECVSLQYDNCVAQLQEQFNKCPMPSTVEYLVNRLIRDLHRMVDNSFEGFNVIDKMSHWYNDLRQNMLRGCSLHLVINAFEVHGLMVQVVRVLNKLMSTAQYQRAVTIKRQFNPYFRGIEVAYNLTISSLSKCAFDETTTPRGVLRQTDPDVVSSSTKTAELVRPEMYPKLITLPPDVVSIWKTLGVPFEHSEFGATRDFFEDLNLSRFSARLRDAFAKFKYEITYVASNNHLIATKQGEAARQLADFHLNEAMNMKNDAKWFLSGQRQKKDQSMVLLESQQKELAALNDNYVKIDKYIETIFTRIKESGPVPYANLKTRLATIQKKTIETEKEVVKLRELVLKHEDDVQVCEADFEMETTIAVLKLADIENEKKRLCQELALNTQLVENIRENAESAETSRVTKKRLKCLEVINIAHKRYRLKLQRNMKHANTNINEFRIAIAKETDQKRREILSETLFAWEEALRQLRRAEGDSDDQFRSRADKVLRGELSTDDALAYEAQNIELPKGIHKIELPLPALNSVKPPTPIGPKNSTPAAPPKRFPIYTDLLYNGIPPIGVIPKNYVKNGPRSWVPQTTMSNSATESASNITTADSTSSSASFQSTQSNHSLFTQQPQPIDQSYEGNYYCSIVRPHFGPSMAKQFAKLQAQRMLPVPF